jgi:uncharacterized protein YprB with RNaseH-like and TPR domain
VTVPAELREIIRRIEATRARERPARRAAPLEELVDGALEDVGAGRLLVVRRRFARDHVHGAQPVRSARDLPAGSVAALAPPGAAGPPPAASRLLYLDTETTGLAGGTGTYAFLVGVGLFDGEAFEVRQYFMRDLDEEPLLLEALAALFQEFDGFVTYNGTGFDLPLLETRFVLARRPWAGDRLHLDLLRPARRLWGGRLADCRLGTLEEHVLGFRRVDDVPGALIPSLYFDFLRRRRGSQMPLVFEHNRHDILSLAALTGWVAQALARAPDRARAPEEIERVGRLLEGTDPERSLACYRAALDGGLPSPGRERLLIRWAMREKRRARWEEARALWEEAARSPSGFDPRPWEEIAKIDEHRRRDLPTARAVVEEALVLARAAGAPAPIVGGLERRLARISRRAAARAS